VKIRRNKKTAGFMLCLSSIVTGGSHIFTNYIHHKDVTVTSVRFLVHHTRYHGNVSNAFLGHSLSFT